MSQPRPQQPEAVSSTPIPPSINNTPILPASDLEEIDLGDATFTVTQSRTPSTPLPHPDQFSDFSEIWYHELASESQAQIQVPRPLASEPLNAASEMPPRPEQQRFSDSRPSFQRQWLGGIPIGQGDLEMGHLDPRPQSQHHGRSRGQYLLDASPRSSAQTLPSYRSGTPTPSYNSALLTRDTFGAPCHPPHVAVLSTQQVVVLHEGESGGLRRRFDFGFGVHGARWRMVKFVYLFAILGLGIMSAYWISVVARKDGKGDEQAQGQQ